MEVGMPATVSRKYEKLMSDIGDFGKYQKTVFLLVVLSIVPNGYYTLMLVFVGRTPPVYRCFDPLFDNFSRGNETDAYVITTEDIYETRSTTALQHGISNNTNSSDGCPYGIIYEGLEDGRTTIVTEWGLMFDRSWILPSIISVQMAGLAVGSVITGPMSDRFGRYPTFLGGTLFMSIFGGLCGVAFSPAMFTVFLFGCQVTGFTTITAFIIASEVINTKDRALAGSLTFTGFAIGYMVLPFFAYFIKSWRTLCFVVASAGVLFVPYIWLMDESPRWLFSKGKKSEFTKLFLKIAKSNGVAEDRARQLIANFYQDISVEEANESINVPLNSRCKTAKNRTSYSYLDLLRHRELRLRTICMWFIWFVCSLVYYGVALSTSDMGGDPYVNCFVAAAVEIPTYSGVVLFLKWRGRKPILSFALVITGITCSVAPYLRKYNVIASISLAMAGKLAVTGAFAILFIFCAELYPTLMRSLGLGSASFAARVGGMLAPYILFLGQSYEEAPYIIMGAMAIMAAGVNLILPETGNVPLPETFADLKSVSCSKILKRKSEVNC